MTRRTLLHMVSATIAALVAGVRVQRGCGLMTVERWRREGYFARRARVLLDGADITDECFEFHDRECWARLFVRDGAGRIQLNADHDGPAQQRVAGRITIKETT
jgi:hypothetical protein